jgi:hypothetical protein
VDLEKLASAPAANGNYRQELAHVYLSQTKLWERTKPAAAALAYRKAVDLDRQLVQNFPEVSVYRSDLGCTLNNWAKWLAELARWDLRLDSLIGPTGPNQLVLLGTELRRKLIRLRAQEMLKEAIVQQQLALKAFPDNTAFRGFLKDAYFNLAEVDLWLGEHKALADTAAEFPLLYPEDPVEYVRAANYLTRCVMLASSQTKLTPAERGKLIDDYGRRAVAYFRQAKQKGFKRIDILKDPFYNLIRNREDFKKLQKEMEEKGPIEVG